MRNRLAFHPLFGFAPKPGAWKLQFDTSRRYRRGKPGADFLFYGIPVSVKRG